MMKGATMNYIIDPSVFYWINVFGILQTVCAVICGVLLTAGICCCIAYFYYRDDTTKRVYDEKKRDYVYIPDKDKLDRIHDLLILTKVCFVLGTVLCVASIFIPGKVASVEMLIARTATFDNVNMTVDGIKDLVDYIVTAIKSAV